MVESIRHIYSHKDLATALIKDQNIHEGLWIVSVQFGLGAINVEEPNDPNSVNPAAVVPVLNMGILKVDKKSALTVDAAEVNPVTRAAGPTSQKKVASKAPAKKAPAKKAPAKKAPAKKAPATAKIR